MKMKTLRRIAAVFTLGCGVGLAAAQPGGGPGPRPGGGMGPGAGMGPGPVASAPGTGPRVGGPGPMRWGADYTPGWIMMTEQERNQHREAMRAMKTYDECKSYQQQHHERMAARAKEQGGKMLPEPRRDPCAGLKR